MKHNLKKLLLQDLFIGAWVNHNVKTHEPKSCPMSVHALYDGGKIELNVPRSEGEVLQSEIENVSGIEICPEIMREFHFEETDHNVFEKKCDGFKVVVTIYDHQHYKLLRAGIHHDNGGFQFDENIVYIHHLQDFVFRSTRKYLKLTWL